MITVFTNGIPSASTLVYLPPEPSIAVTGQAQAIATGDTTPSSTDGTDFGVNAVLTAQTIRSFTIASTGSATLHLTGSSAITLSGPSARDFKVLTTPAVELDPGSSTSFDISFQPKGPGQRDATVTIACDDPTKPSFTFVISGFGKLPTNTAQTITFTPPSSLYLSQSPFTLSASASSGLPVTLGLVAPVPVGTTLVNGVLNFSTIGTVKVQATCPAGGNYNAAVPVVKSIILKANPSVLTLIDLTQVYDGNPKQVMALGGTGTPVITYKVGASYVGTAPTAAGSYPVKAVSGTKTASGTLIITKAPLRVMPDHQFKFAGRANPVLTFTYSGFVNGETASVVTTAAVLRTTATLSSPGGIYPITASGGAAANYSFVYMPASLTVASFAGSYEALLVNGSSIPTGKLSITVASSAANSFTGKLYTGSETTALPIAGTLATNLITDQASSTAYFINSDGIPYVINFTLPFSLSSSVIASVMRDNALLGDGIGQKLSTATVNYAGAHTAVLEPATPTGALVPRGAGWATATIGSTGVLTLTGRLGDDTAFTTALIPDKQTTPGYRLFAQPYPSARKQSFIAGAFALASHPTLTSRRYLAEHALTWQKVGQASDVSYRSGFGPVSTVLMIDPWQAPKTTAPTITLAQRLGLSAPSFHATHSATGSASQAHLPTQLGLSPSNVVSVLSPVANQTTWKTLTFVPSTGTFTGSFVLTDAAQKRTVTFSGVLRQPATAMDALIGDGSYVLPPQVGIEKSTGEVMFIRP